MMSEPRPSSAARHGLLLSPRKINVQVLSFWLRVERLWRPIGSHRDPGIPPRRLKVTTDLRYLVYTSMLTAVLWIPYVICQVMTNGPLQPKNYVDPALPRPVPAWGQRAHRTYLNAVEVFAPFAALVIVTQLAGKANATTAFWSASFFYLRLAHAIVYWARIPVLRTILFTLAFIAEAGIFWELIK